MAAFDLTNSKPFAKQAFSFDMIDRPGFTFDPDFTTTDFSDWKKEFESKMPDLNITVSGKRDMGTTYNLSTSSSNPLDYMGNMLMGSDNKQTQTTGYALKTAAAAGELFQKMLTVGYEWGNANRRAGNTKQSVENQMLALDNQILYYKNLITDKFSQTMARNAVTMAAKNLRVTAGNLLEQTKDVAYDATKDIQMMESNAELKKSALRAESKQADVTKKLTKQLLASDLVGSFAKVGLMVSAGKEAGLFGKLFTSDTGSLNDSVYGDLQW